MKIIDISWPTENNITEYKDRVSVNITKDLISLNPHTGTHVDSPAHFINGGKTIDQVDLSRLIGRCKVLDLTSIKEKITEQDLKDIELNTKIDQEDIVLLKTRNSFLDYKDKFDYNFVYLDKTGAQYLESKKIRSLGIDYLGIERDQKAHETHEILLSNDILIIEGLRLKDIKMGIYYFYCLPIFIRGLDASPARAILIEERL